MTAFDGLPEPLRAALPEEGSPLALTCQGFITTAGHFLGAAQPWVRGRDLFLSALAAGWASGAAMADGSLGAGAARDAAVGVGGSRVGRSRLIRLRGRPRRGGGLRLAAASFRPPGWVDDGRLARRGWLIYVPGPAPPSL